MSIHVSTKFASERRHVARCYCSEHAERLARAQKPDGLFNGQSHPVEIPYDGTLHALGWGRRAGRLPISPECRRPDDEDY